MSQIPLNIEQPVGRRAGVGWRPLHRCGLACPQRKQGEDEAETTGAENTKVALMRHSDALIQAWS